jgi:hypothetical protein
MAKKRVNQFKVYIDPIGNTLNLWWDDPKKSVLSEEADQAWDVICLDKKGRRIGLKKIGFFPLELDPVEHLHMGLKDRPLSGKVLALQ